MGMRTALSLVFTLIGALLAVVNLLYLPLVLSEHRREWPVAVFHLAVIVASVALALGGWRMRQRKPVIAAESESR